MNLAEKIKELSVSESEIGLIWLGQASFIIKTHEGTLIAIDPYLSNCCNRLLKQHGFGFKRLMPAPITDREIIFDYILISHDHPDHLDNDCIFNLCDNDKTVVYASEISTRRAVQEFGVPAEKIHCVKPGDEIQLAGYQVLIADADHAEADAPDAVGFIFDFGFTKLYYAGDTSLNREKLTIAKREQPDVALLPINGAFNGMNETEAAIFAGEIGAKMVIPYHFWMFAMHLGEPVKFEPAMEQYAPNAKPYLMSQCEIIKIGAIV